MGISTGEVIVASDVRALDTRQGARVYNSGNQSITNATYTTLTFDTETYDNDGIHSSVTNSSRLTVQTAGKYLIESQWAWSASPSTMHCKILYNATTALALYQVQSAGPNDGSIATIYDMSVGAFVEVQLRQTSGGAINALGNVEYPFSIQHVG